MAKCPTKEQLKELAEGKLFPETEGKIFRHLACCCSECWQVCGVLVRLHGTPANCKDLGLSQKTIEKLERRVVEEIGKHIGSGNPTAEELRQAYESELRGEQTWLRQFPDKWALLDARPEMIIEAAEADPRGCYADREIELVTKLLLRLRTLYGFAAKGGPVVEEDEVKHREASEAVERIWVRVLPVPAARASSEGGVTHVRHSLTLADPVAASILSMRPLSDLIQALRDGLDDTSPRNLLVCAYCGKICPRTRGATHQKYCCDSHRQRAYQLRTLRNTSRVRL